MFGIPAWVLITAGALVALVAFVVLGAVILAGKQHTPQPPRHQRPPGNHPRIITREAWLNGTDIIPRAPVAGAPPWAVRDEPGPLTRQLAQVIEGPWGAPVRQYPVEDLPAPELLDDLPPVPAKLDGCSCVPVGSSHRPPCAWAMQNCQPELDENLPPDQDAFGLCGCMCLCFDGADGPDNMCPRCRAGNHAPRRAADDDDPGWVTRLAAELDEDQAAELDDRDLAGTLDELYEEQGGEFVEDLDEAAPDPLDAVRDYWAWQPPAPAEEPELVLAVEAHAAQLRAQDADAKAFMEGKAAEFLQLRQAL